MRVILIMVGLVGLTAWAGYAVRKQDAIASAMLFAFSALAALGLIGAFFGWFGG